MLSKFYIIRHGETDWNALGLVNGLTDRALNENGIRQAKEAGDRIFSTIDILNLKSIVHSPLSRAKNTAEIINENLNLSMIEIEELRETNCGELEGKPHPSYETWQKWTNGEFIGNGVESAGDAKKRINIALEKLLKYENPLVVAHGGTFFSLCSVLKVKDFNDVNFENCTPYCIENTSIGYRIFKVFENQKSA